MNNHHNHSAPEVLKSTYAAAAVATCWGIGQQADAQVVAADEYLLEIPVH